MSGVDYYLGPHDSPEARAEYASLVAELARDGGAGPGRPRADAAKPSGFTVGEVLARWCEHAQRYYSERGRERENIALALEPLERLFGDQAAASFDADKLEQLQEAMLSGSWLRPEDRQHPRRPKEGGWSLGVVNRRIVKVRTVWRWAESKKLVPPGSWAALIAVRAVRANRPGVRVTSPRKSTTLAEVKAVRRCVPAPIGAMLLAQWWTGMRSAEVRTMRAGDVEAVGDGWTYRPREHKTDYLGHRRTVILGRRAVAVLRPWLEAARAAGPDAPLFPSPGCNARGGKGRGEPYTRDGYAHAVRRGAEAAGVAGFHAYLCRHATRMRVSREFGDEAARSTLGQRSLDVALRYGELDLELAKEAQRKLG